MTKSRPRKNQSERPDLPQDYLAIIIVIYLYPTARPRQQGLTFPPLPPYLHISSYTHKMAGILKVAALFGICTAFAAVLIAWYLKESFDPENVRGKKVVICGASTGIGEELAYQYAKLGAQLLLVARREEVLKKVVARCAELGAETANYVVADLSSLEAAKNLADVRNVVQLTKYNFKFINISVLCTSYDSYGMGGGGA